MILFAFHKYKLEPMTQLGSVASSKAREGALLKCQWPDGKTGYADLFPWPELGDQPLRKHLMELARGHLSPLTEQAIWLARKDAKLRDAKANGVSSAAKIKNHYLVNDLSKVKETDLAAAKSAGFSSVKIKMGQNLLDELAALIPILRISGLNFRLDLNSHSNPQEFEKFITSIDASLRSRIEFVEDPFPYEHDSWMAASKLVPLALDNEEAKVDWSHVSLGKKPFQVLVLKPARQDVDRAIRHCLDFELKCVVTSSLDHPVGVIHSVLTASDVRKALPGSKLDFGCLSIRAYKPNEFSSKIVTQGPYITEVAGTGIGFDSVLGNLKWTSIAQA